MGIWDDAIEDATKRPPNPNAEVKRRRESVELSSALGAVMEMYKYNLPIIFRESQKIYDILKTVGIDDGSFFLEDSFEELLQSLKSSILDENYNENYDKALEVLVLCLEYYVNPEGYKKAQEANAVLEEILNGTFKIPDDLNEDEEEEGTKLSSTAEGDTKHYTILTKDEFNHHISFLHSLEDVAGKLGFTNIQSLISQVINKIEDYYKGNPAKFDQNFVERGYSKDSAIELKELLSNDLASWLEKNYSIEPVRGAFPYQVKVSVDKPTDEAADKLVKKIIEHFYNKLLDSIDELELEGKPVKRYILKSFAEKVRDHIDSLVEVLDVKVLREILQSSGDSFDSAMHSSDLNWASGFTIAEGLESWLKGMKRDILG